MTQTLRTRGVAFSVAVLAGGMLAATPVQAAAPVPVPGQPYGTITSTTGLNERAYPSTDSPVRATLTHNTKAGLRCKVRAQRINNSDTWYLLRDRPTWVHGGHVSNTGNVPFCRDMTHAVQENSTPVVRAAEG
ncbi:SH3 domain-containing protein [Streptomyces sp. UNOC14_S4]|uniref:SH3 domain-containing protein n=1 Tax=Streptomyces sp. UNOC14_S4 TaxID=2872340 RepID=UPI001E2FCD78|nr:SH3 domain-containing protein [Streptomyces sp. UNOC14_S4]